MPSIGRWKTTLLAASGQGEPVQRPAHGVRAVGGERLGLRLVVWVVLEGLEAGARALGGPAKDGDGGGLCDGDRSTGTADHVADERGGPFVHACYDTEVSIVRVALPGAQRRLTLLEVYILASAVNPGYTQWTHCPHCRRYRG